jgi:hypothetical protein
MLQFFFIEDADPLCTLTSTDLVLDYDLGFVDLCSITLVIHLSQNIFVYGATNLSRSPVSSNIFVNQSVHLHR